MAAKVSAGVACRAGAFWAAGGFWAWAGFFALFWAAWAAGTARVSRMAAGMRVLGSLMGVSPPGCPQGRYGGFYEAKGVFVYRNLTMPSPSGRGDRGEAV